MTQWFHKCLVYTYSVDWVKEQSGWSFFGIIYDNSGHYDYNSKLNLHFVEWSSALVEYIGGKAYEFEPSEFNDWVLTIRRRPLPTNYNLMPISFLIEVHSLL